MRLTRDFFAGDTIKVAQNLLGKTIVYNNKKGIITETEAYRGVDDPACHGCCGITRRNKVMFGVAGYTYVYLIYGVYYCLNFVTEAAGLPAAVLIRGVLADNNYNGPGKLCRYYNITTADNNIDITNNDNFYVLNNNTNDIKYTSTPRIGIKKGLDKLWRFKML